MQSRKKVLIISHNKLSERRNNGITLYNIFQMWPDDKLFQIYFNDESVGGPRSIRYVHLGLVNLMKSFLRTADNTHMKSPESSNVSESFRSSCVFRNAFFRIAVRDLLYFLFFRVSGSIGNQLRRFKPESVFLMAGGSMISFVVAVRISQALKIPFSVFITDNYVDVGPEDGLASRGLALYTDLIYRHFFSKAQEVFVISDELRDVVCRRYNVTSQILINPGRVTLGSRPTQDEGGMSKSPAVIGFFGGLHFDRLSSIVLFAERLLTAYPQMIIKIFSHSHISHSHLPANILLQDPVYGLQLVEEIMSSDILLHAESFDPTYFKDIRYSVSTKIPEAMMYRKPLVCVGPSAVSSVRLLKNNELAYVFDEVFFFRQGPIEGCSQLQFSQDRLNENTLRAYKYWAENFSPAVIDKLLVDQL